MKFFSTVILVVAFAIVPTAEGQDNNADCPRGWELYGQSCYRFVRSPLKNREGSLNGCQAYNAYLLSVNTMEEHAFLLQWLRTNDPQHRSWYTSGIDVGNNQWRWQGDNTPMVSMDVAWLPDQHSLNARFAVYSYEDRSSRWGLRKVPGTEPFAFVCEIPLGVVRVLVFEDRGYDYGDVIVDPERTRRAPYWIKEPVYAIYDISGQITVKEVSLRCAAGGFPYPSYKWYKEGKEIDPMSDSRLTQTDGTLTIYKPEQLRDRGTYHCKATNQYGSVISRYVELNFGYIGQFNLKRSNEVGRESWGKAIFCDPPQHYPDVNYYWSRESMENFVEEDKRVFVSQDGNLYFSSLETIDRGQYSCNVQSPASSTGRTGPFFAIEVLPHSSNQQLQFPNNFPKAFPKAPTAGGDVRLECVAFGYPVPSYNWTRKGYSSSLPAGYSTTNYNRVLILPKVAVEDSGEYICTADNGKNAITATVTLSIQALPTFTVPLQDMHMDKGGTIAWNCEAFGNPEVKYEWLRNGDYLLRTLLPQDAPRYTVRSNVLTIRDLNPERDQGVYQCKATNQLGSAFSSGELRVLTLAPSFRKYPIEPVTYAAEGGNVTVPCRPEGAPTPRFQWRRDGQPVNPDGRVQVLQNGNLVIMSVLPSDEARYTCAAANEYGRAESEGRLVVIRRPSFVRRPQESVSVLVDDVVRLDCEAQVDHNIELGYVWKVNGIRVDHFKHHRYLTGTMDAGSLDIYNVSYYDRGQLECEAKTPMDTIVAVSQVLVRGPPGEVGGLQTVSTSGKSVQLRWTDGPSYGQSLSSYDIESRNGWNSTWTLLLKDIPAAVVDPILGRREAIIDGSLLSPWSHYEFRVIPKNVYGSGVPSQASPAFTTKEDRPYRPPEDIGGGGGNAGDLTITWKPLAPQYQNAPGIWYKVSYKLVDSQSDYRTVEMQDERNVGMKVINVGANNYYTQYKVRVQPFNRVGPGPESPEVVIYSAEDRPRATPNEVSARSFNGTAINVTWQPVDTSRESIRGQLVGFRIKYWRRDLETPEDATYHLSRSTENWAMVVGLQPNTYYMVVAMVFNVAGSGPESEPFIERTFKSAPLKPPTSVNIFTTSLTSIRVTWRSSAPSQIEEPLQGFKVRYWEIDQDFVEHKDVYIGLGGNLEADVTGLTPRKMYVLRVLAYSLGGDGRMSSPAIAFSIESGKRSSAPRTVGWSASLLVLLAAVASAAIL